MPMGYVKGEVVSNVSTKVIGLANDCCGLAAIMPVSASSAVILAGIVADCPGAAQTLYDEKLVASRPTIPFRVRLMGLICPAVGGVASISSPDERLLPVGVVSVAAVLLSVATIWNSSAVVVTGAVTETVHSR